MHGNRNWFPLPKKDAIFILFIILYVILMFLPWSHNIKILNISLLAWGAALLFLLAPITGILLTISEKPQSEMNQPIDKGEKFN